MIIQEAFRNRKQLLANLAENLQRDTIETLMGIKHIDRVVFRAKDETSFLRKAADPKKKYQYPLIQIEDQVAGRIIVFFLEDIEIVIKALSKLFNDIESVRKEPSNEREFGYESHHLICMIPPQCEPHGWNSQADMPRTFELQIRTLFMHAWAEPQHDAGYKPDLELPREIRREWAWAAAAAWGADQALQRVLNWYRTVSNTRKS